MKKLVIVYVALIIAVLLLAFFRYGGNLPAFAPLGTRASVLVEDKKINLIVAKTEKDRIKGLSGRNSLDKNSGMLFVFEKKDKYSFWMKDMKFPIDIIHISDDTVVEIFENVPIAKNGENLKVYKPSTPANYVLELNAGKSKEFNIKKGTKLTLQNIK